MPRTALKIALLFCGLITFTLSKIASQSLTYLTPRRSIREVLNSSPAFTDEMTEELLMTSDQISENPYALPMFHLLYDDMVHLIDELSTDFSEIIKVETIGHTYEGRPMRMLEMTLRNESDQGLPEAKTLLLTGAHHSRELASIQLPLLVLLRILHSYMHGDPHTQALLEVNKLLVVPVVNVDGFKFINDQYKSTGRLLWKRKNQNYEYQSSYVECEEEDAGVDLNRNYDWAFGASMFGSSMDPCDQTFRGPYPFSEPETRAMRDLIGNKSTELKVVYNFHSYGNFFLHPFSNDAKSNSMLVIEYPEQARIYREIWEDNGLPHGNTKGNGERCVEYRVDGDSADWILGTYGIISASPELGTTDYRSYNFFILQKEVLLEILNQNSPWVLNTFKKLGPQMGFNHIHTTLSNDTREVAIEFEVLNKGFSDFKTVKSSFDFDFESNIFNITSIEGIDNMSQLPKTKKTQYSYKVSMEQNEYGFKSREGVRIVIHAILPRNFDEHMLYETAFTLKFKPFENINEIQEHRISFADITNSVGDQRNRLVNLSTHVSTEGEPINYMLIFGFIIIFGLALAYKPNKKLLKSKVDDHSNDIQEILIEK